MVSAPDLKSCPNSPLPEFAFIGRSNVGKSSLINMLTEKSDLAKVSDLPGKTKLINFFVVNDRWALVDLPGYGYAHVARSERANFQKSVADYLENRKNIYCVFVLIDSRLSPQRIDLEFVQWLSGCEVPFALIFTKTDKQSVTKGQANVALFTQTMLQWSQAQPHVISSSAKTRSGRTDILKFIQETLASARQMEQPA